MAPVLEAVPDGPRWICKKEMRPLAERADRPVPRGDPSHALPGELAITPIESMGPPWRSRFKLENASGRNLRDVEIFGDAGDHWVVSLDAGDWVDVNGLKPDTRLWGK